MTREDIPYLLDENARLRERYSQQTDMYFEACEDRRTMAAEIERLANIEARLRAELEAAKRDFHDYVHHRHESCAFCIHDDECEPGESLCYANKIGWEWRGLCAENGGTHE